MQNQKTFHFFKFKVSFLPSLLFIPYVSLTHSCIYNLYIFTYIYILFLSLTIPLTHQIIPNINLLNLSQAFHQTPYMPTYLNMNNYDVKSVKSKFQEVGIAQNVVVSDLVNDFDVTRDLECVNSLTLSEKSSYSCVSYCSTSSSLEVNENNFKSFTQLKPHKGSDFRWDAVQNVKARDGGLNLGHFRLLKKLGFGDIGSVYLAELRGFSGCLFAMKVMDKGMLEGRKKLVRAQTEKDILGILDHPFLPTLYSHFETDKFSCLLMEFCSGGDLHILRQRQPGKHFSEQAARFYASEVLLALEYLHMMGVVYRDLKPENVMVREDGHIMLTDFDLSLRCNVNPTLVKSSIEPTCTGSSYCIDPSFKLPVCVEPACFQPSCFKPMLFNSKSKKNRNERVKATLVSPNFLPMLNVEPTTARSMSFVGTHEYLAPEIIRGDGHGSAVDWWTFGIFLYELLHAKTPFKGSGNRETLFNVVGHTLKFPEGSTISFAAKDLIKSLLVKDPKKRLGYKRGATEIKQHPFFESLNWALVRSNDPPEIPKAVDLSIYDQTTKSPLPQRSDSDRSSGPYLDFEFF